MKKNILNIIDCLENNRFNEIDEIKLLWPIAKMKIAYLYSPDNFTSVMSKLDIQKKHARFLIYNIIISFQFIQTTYCIVK